MTLLLQFQVHCHPYRDTGFSGWTKRSIGSLLMKDRQIFKFEEYIAHRDERSAFHGYERDNLHQVLRCNELKLSSCHLASEVDWQCHG
jgi:hypothetical protein